jgi:hypothetical protein
MKIIVCFGVVLLSVLLQACDQGQARVYVANDYVKAVEIHRKPGAKVSLDNRQVNLAVSGAQYAINVDINSAYDSGQMTLVVTGSEGLFIVGGDVNPTMALSKGVMTLPYTVIASEDGRYYLHLNATVEKNGVIAVRALTLIVQVGDESKALSTASQKANNGSTGVVSMTAKEEIIVPDK